jgi:hypothetical protein
MPRSKSRRPKEELHPSNHESAQASQAPVATSCNVSLAPATIVTYSLGEAAMLLKLAQTPERAVRELKYLLRIRRIGCYRNPRTAPTFGPHHLHNYHKSIEEPCLVQENESSKWGNTGFPSTAPVPSGSVLGMTQSLSRPAAHRLAQATFRRSK